MAYDGFFIKSHIDSIRDELVGNKIEKIYQPSENEILLTFRNREKSMILFSISSQNPRFLMIQNKAQMPTKAPIFCMFLRKHLSSAVLIDIRQHGYERIVFFDFEARNELGDIETKTICMEIMGKHSNFMLLNSKGIVLDSLKRVGSNISIRPIYGGIEYVLPPTTKHKVDLVDADFIMSFLEDTKNKISKKLYMEIQGLSPSISTSICIESDIDLAKKCKDITYDDACKIKTTLDRVVEENSEKKAIIYIDERGLCKEISSIELKQFKLDEKIVADSFDAAISRYFDENKNENKYTQRLNLVKKRLDALVVHRRNKIENLTQDIEKASRLEDYKLYGELIFANLYAIKEKSSEIMLNNYYNSEMIKIPLNPLLDGNSNAQAYYKKYNKAKTTLDLTQKQLDTTLEEVVYLENAYESLNNVSSYDDIAYIVEELENTGFFSVKNNARKKKKKEKQVFQPIKYKSTQGVEIWVGRNNVQNDELTLKKSDKDFIWLHVKDMAGSHTVIRAKFEDVDESTIYEAASIAAYHSKAKNSYNVPVDLTEIKFVHKPNGAKPGMVIYTDNKTVYVEPKLTNN